LSLRFVAGNDRRHDCPPTDLLAASFRMAGTLIWRSPHPPRRVAVSVRDGRVAILGVANNALYRGLGYTGMSRPTPDRRADRLGQSGVHRRAGREVLGEKLNLAARVAGLLSAFSASVSSLASHVGRYRQPARPLSSRCLPCLDSRPATSVKVLAPRAACGSAMAAESHRGHRADAVRVYLRRCRATSCRARGLPRLRVHRRRRLDCWPIGVVHR